MSQPAETFSPSAVVIISDDPEFARAVVGRWQAERQVPVFTLLGSDLCNGAHSAAWDLAIVGPVREGKLAAVLQSSEASPAATLLVTADPAAALLCHHSRITLVRQYDGWVETVALLGCEILRRVEAVARMQQAERTANLSQQLAILGRYMLDMRHSFNNAMTSMLGNAELLLLEPAAFSAQVREQIDTIHTMALRMHEIMQRFTSLETEMQFADGAPQIDSGSRAPVLLPAQEAPRKRPRGEFATSRLEVQSGA